MNQEILAALLAARDFIEKYTSRFAPNEAYIKILLQIDAAIEKLN